MATSRDETIEEDSIVRNVGQDVVILRDKVSALETEIDLCRKQLRSKDDTSEIRRKLDFVTSRNEILIKLKSMNRINQASIPDPESLRCTWQPRTVTHRL